MTPFSLLRVNFDQNVLFLGTGTPGECGCGCLYSGSGGSPSGDNDAANNAEGLHSGGGSTNNSGTECGYTEVNVTVSGCEAPAGCNSTTGC